MSINFSAVLIRGWEIPTEDFPDNWDDDGDLQAMVEGDSDQPYALLCDDYTAGFGLRVAEIDDKFVIPMVLDTKPEVSDAEIEQRYKDVFGKLPDSPPKLIAIPHWG